MSDKSDAPAKKTARQEKLAAALRANLQRRKAARQESRKAARQESRKAGKRAGEKDSENG